MVKWRSDKERVLIVAMQKKEEERPATHREDEILDVKQVATMLGRSPPTIHRWISEGLIAVVRMPSGLKKVRRSTVENFLLGTSVSKKPPVIEEFSA